MKMKDTARRRRRKQRMETKRNWKRYLRKVGRR